MEAGEVDEAEEVFDVVFPSGDEASEVMHPSEQSFHFPASSVPFDPPTPSGFLRLVICSA